MMAAKTRLQRLVNLLLGLPVGRKKQNNLADVKFFHSSENVDTEPALSIVNSVGSQKGREVLSTESWKVNLLFHHSIDQGSFEDHQVGRKHAQFIMATGSLLCQPIHGSFFLSTVCCCFFLYAPLCLTISKAVIQIERCLHVWLWVSAMSFGIPPSRFTHGR